MAIKTMDLLLKNQPNKMKSIYFFIIYIITFGSCIYKAGNRQADINYDYEVTVSPFYIKKYMKTLDSLYPNRPLITSEIVNFPENFIPVTDSIRGYKYVIEFNGMDSLQSVKLNYFGLASIYDFKKEKWITERDSLKNNELENFRLFFKDSVLKRVIHQYQNKIPDSLLFTVRTDTIGLKPLK